MTPKGAKLLEIAARPGGNRAQIMLNAFGIDLMYAYYNVVLGLVPEISIQKQNVYAIVTPFPLNSGTFMGINKDNIQNLNSYLKHSIKAKFNTIIGPVSEGFFAPISIELGGTSLEAVYSDIVNIANMKNLFILNV